MIPIQQFYDGVTTFAVNDVISTMPNNMAKFVSLMAVGSMRNNPDTFIKQYEPMLKSIGILSADGTMVDETNLKSGLAEAFATMPKISWMGFTFSSEDATKLLQRIGF